MKPNTPFMVGMHSTILYFDDKGDILKEDGTKVTETLMAGILANPDIIREVAWANR